MSLTIEKSPVFQNEYQMWKTKISTMENEVLKKELEGLLHELLMNVRKIDSIHHSPDIKNNITSSAVDSRSKVSDIRKKLTKKITDWEKIKK